MDIFSKGFKCLYNPRGLRKKIDFQRKKIAFMDGFQGISHKMWRYLLLKQVHDERLYNKHVLYYLVMYTLLSHDTWHFLPTTWFRTNKVFLPVMSYLPRICCAVNIMYVPTEHRMGNRGKKGRHIIFGPANSSEFCRLLSLQHRVLTPPPHLPLSALKASSLHSNKLKSPSSPLG